MINKDYFRQTRILDGGMGQELLARGMKPNGTLWSANAIINPDYHKLLSDTHLDFIKAGAEVIVTARRQDRLEELAKKIESAGGKVHIFNEDLSLPESGK